MVGPSFVTFMLQVADCKDKEPDAFCDDIYARGEKYKKCFETLEHIDKCLENYFKKISK